MSAAAPEFVVPREQFPSRAFLCLSRHNSAALRSSALQTASFFWARNAIYHALQAFGISTGAHVLLPAYLCRAAVEPFEFVGATVEFYSIDRSCQPALREIESKIRPSTKAVMLCHYFGFPQRIEHFRALCDRHRIALIEDCAHVLTGCYQGRPLGTFGDASVFSRRKFLPIYDGGELWLNRKGLVLAPEWENETALFTLKVAKSLFDRTVENSSSSLARSLSWTIETLKSAAKRLRRNAGDAPLFALDSNQATFDSSLLHQPMSRVSRWVQSHCDVNAIVEARRLNFQFLLENTRDLPGVTPLHAALPDSVCPWIFPAIFENLPDAHLRLQEEGVPAVNWAGVRPRTLCPGAFPETDWIYDHLVFLPLHQNLSRGALEFIANTVCKLSASSTAKEGALVFASSAKIA
jgi:perosamine synthetase